MCGLMRNTAWGLLNPLCWEEEDVQGPGSCSGRWGLGSLWERDKAVTTHIRASVCCSAFQLFAASSPVVCHSYSQLFAVQHSIYLQSLPTYLQPYPQECAITTPAVCSHHRYLQSPPTCSRSPSQLSAGPPSARYNLFPAVCNHHPSYVQFPSHFGHQVRLVQD